MGQPDREEELMHHFFVAPDQICGDHVCVEGQDCVHIRQVLRMKPGEELYVKTGSDGKEYRCRITKVRQEMIELEILWTEDAHAELPSRICLYQCLPKSDKMEWIIQKAVELGASEIIPVSSARSIVRLEGSKAANKVRRWNAISESAAKQSRRDRIPVVRDVCTFAEAVKDAASLDVFLIPYELAEDIGHTRKVLAGIMPGQSVGIMIGPEGGLEKDEVALACASGAVPVTLGRRILRTETAGMTLLSFLMISLEPADDTPEQL